MIDRAIWEAPIKRILQISRQYGEKESLEQVLVEEIQPFAKTNNPQVLFQFALLADLLRVIFESVVADGDVADQGIRDSRQVLQLVAKAFAGVRAKYAGFASLTDEGTQLFLSTYKNDEGLFGYQNKETKWAGIRSCVKLDEQNESETFDLLATCLKSLATLFASSDGVLSDTERSYLQKLEITFRCIQDGGSEGEVPYDESLGFDDCWGVDPEEHPTEEGEAWGVLDDDSEEESDLAVESCVANDKDSDLHHDAGDGVEGDDLLTKLYRRIQENHRVGDSSSGFVEVHQVRENIDSWKELAAHGNSKAQVILAALFSGGIGVDENDEESFRLGALAAAQNDTLGMFLTGLSYYYGIGVNEDEEKAFPFLNKAAEAGHSRAQDLLGRAYRFGQGVAEDEEKALHWYRLAAEQGNKDAQDALGAIYRWGLCGVDEDLEGALHWYRLAADQGLKCAIESLDDLETELRKFKELTLEAVLEGNDGDGDGQWVDHLDKFRSIAPDAVEHIVEYLHERDELYRFSVDGITKVTPALIKELNAHAWRGDEDNWSTVSLQFDSLKEIDQECCILLGRRLADAPDFIRSNTTLALNGLKELDKDSISHLSKFVGSLELNGLENLSNGAATALLGRETDLSLDGLKHLSSEFIDALDSFHGDSLSLRGVEELNDKTAEKLFKEGRSVNLFGLKKITSAQLMAMYSGEEEPYVWLPNVSEIDLATAECLKTLAATQVNIGITSISIEVAKVLSASTQDLNLKDLEVIDVEVLQQLIKCKELAVGIKNLTDDAAGVLAEHKGVLDISCIESMSTAAATALIKHEGKINLSWEYKEFSDEVVQILRQHPSLFSVEPGESAAIPETLLISLRQLGVSSVSCSYDGSGDDGTMEATITSEEGSQYFTSDYKGLAELAEEMTENNELLILSEVRKVLEATNEFIWAAIPGGWEIDAGSTGSVELDISDEGTILCEHSPKDEWDCSEDDGDDEDEESDWDCSEDDGDDGDEESDGNQEGNNDAQSLIRNIQDSLVSLSRMVDGAPGSFEGNSECVHQFLGCQDKTGEDLFVNPDGAIYNSIGMCLIPISPGTFEMGDEEVDEGETKGHSVKITKPFYLGMFQVTQGEYATVIGSNPSYYKGKNRPVEHLSWDQAANFCRALSDLPAEKAAGRKYRLPSEAEWEYACRAGTDSDFNNGKNSIECSEANFSTHGMQNSPQPTLPVGSFKPNNWGFYDMHGNVWEWCADWFDDEYYEESPECDPSGPQSGDHHALRGGAASNAGYECRSFYRGEAATNDGPTYRLPAHGRFENLGDFGLRVVCEVTDG